VIVFCKDVDAIKLEKIGPMLETHAIFPKRINVHFAQVNKKNDVKMRTWERGSGITWACGTGACSVVVAGVLTGRLDRKAKVHLPGGDLNIEWREADNNIYMTGPATEVYSGEWSGE
jgi:diaminopimelate epimerase